MAILRLRGRGRIPALFDLIGKGVIPSPWLRASSVLQKYIRDPEYFWRYSDIRQAIKVLDVRRPFSLAGFYSPAEVADRCLTEVGELSEAKYDRPVFIIGPGSCGSHWLGQILGDLPQLHHGKEIYVPRSLSLLYDLIGNSEMANLIWACMVLNTWGLAGPKKPFAGDIVVSNRPNIVSLRRYRRIWPQSRWIWLMRDPRDQALSMTYRKQRYRAFIARDLSDDQYLERNCRSAISFCSTYQAIKEQVYMVRYEDLRADTIAVVRGLLDYLGITVKEEELDKAVFQNDAGNMRKGLVSKHGNLDEGGVAQCWREIMTDHQRTVCKPILEDVVEYFGYDQREDW